MEELFTVDQYVERNASEYSSEGETFQAPSCPFRLAETPPYLVVIRSLSVLTIHRGLGKPIADDVIGVNGSHRGEVHLSPRRAHCRGL